MTCIKAAFIGIALALVCSVFATRPAAADTIVRTDHVEAELVSDMIEIAPGQEFWVALRQKLDPDWHTYWKNPGDSGEPIRIRWELPPGFEAGEIEWPAPERLPVGPLMNFGYSNEVFLLTRVIAPRSLERNRTIDIKADAEWLVCYEICIPEEATLELRLRPATGPSVSDPVWASTLKDVEAALPRPLPWRSSVSMADGRVVLSVAGADIAKPFIDSYVREVLFFPDDDGWIRNAAPQSARYGDGGFSLWMEPGYRISNRGEALEAERLSGILVLRQALPGGVGATQNAFRVEAAAGPVLAGTEMNVMLGADGAGLGGMSIWRALFFALLGGLILNLMPCVLPILAMKAVGFVGKIGAERRQQRLNGLAYAAGVVATFTVVAAVMLSLREAGEQIGWGYQLQSPVFVVLMAYLMFLIGLNLSGIFEIGGSLLNVRPLRALAEGHQSAFGIGVVSVVVATPCTAPFMATAMGFALTQPATTALAIFVALGIGMALPYLVLTFSPALSQLLPRPGPWLPRFRQFLAFPMFATVVWLVWVLSIEAGPQGVLLALAGMVLLAFAIWLFLSSRGAASGWLIAGRGFGLAAVVAALMLSLSAEPTATPRFADTDEDEPSTLLAEPYAPERIAELRREGRPVFVNFTAAWCVTCLWNEKAVLSRATVAAAFEAAGVVYMKADWTNRDGRIAKALARYGRNGVPLYLLFPPGPGGEDGAHVLPQILTVDMVLSAVANLSLMAPELDAELQTSANRP